VTSPAAWNPGRSPRRGRGGRPAGRARPPRAPPAHAPPARGHRVPWTPASLDLVRGPRAAPVCAAGRRRVFAASGAGRRAAGPAGCQVAASSAPLPRHDRHKAPSASRICVGSSGG